MSDINESVTTVEYVVEGRGGRGWYFVGAFVSFERSRKAKRFYADRNPAHKFHIVLKTITEKVIEG